MEITIDEAIKELSKWRKDLDYDNGDYYYGGDTTEHSLDVALEIMRKYQKIKEIVRWNNAPSPYYKPDGQLFREISEVIEDGNDN